MSLDMIVVLAVLVTLLFLGFPIVVSMGFPAVIWLLMNPRMPDTILAQNMMSYMTSFTLIALPGFLFVGRLMNACGVTDKLFRLAISTVGRFRGGMAQSNAFSSVLFATMSGSAIADAGGMGQVLMRMMRKAGYKPEFAAGITASSSIIGPIIPPSMAMVMLGTIAEVPVAQMFFGGIIPGLLLCAALMIQVGLRALFTAEGRAWPSISVPFKEGFFSALDAIPSMMTFVIIMGAIYTGITTPTEAAVLAVLYSIFLGIIYRKLTLKLLWETLKQTGQTCGPLFIIMASAGIFAWVLTREGLPQMLSAWMQNLSYAHGNIIVLLACLAVILFVGCFMDTISTKLLLAPIIFPVVNAIGMDPVHFGVAMTLAAMIGIITPPFGICVFVVSGVAKLPVRDVQREAIRYLPAMVIVLLLITFIPDIVLFLPRVLMGYIPR